MSDGRVTDGAGYDWGSLARYAVMGTTVFPPLMFHWYKWLDARYLLVKVIPHCDYIVQVCRGGCRAGGEEGDAGPAAVHPSHAGHLLHRDECTGGQEGNHQGIQVLHCLK